MNLTHEELLDIKSLLDLLDHVAAPITAIQAPAPAIAAAIMDRIERDGCVHQSSIEDVLKLYGIAS